MRRFDYEDAKSHKFWEATAAPGGARNRELEAALAEQPDNLDAWQVYADWLQTQGDVCGERISERRG